MSNNMPVDKVTVFHILVYFGLFWYSDSLPFGDAKYIFAESQTQKSQLTIFGWFFSQFLNWNSLMIFTPRDPMVVTMWKCPSRSVLPPAFRRTHPISPERQLWMQIAHCNRTYRTNASTIEHHEPHPAGILSLQKMDKCHRWQAWQQWSTLYRNWPPCCSTRKLNQSKIYQIFIGKNLISASAPHLKIKVHTLAQIGFVGEAFVFSHIKSERIVSIGRFSL